MIFFHQAVLRDCLMIFAIKCVICTISLLQLSTRSIIMSVAEEPGGPLMTRMNVAAQFYFGYYYFFTEKE